jgi:hypothetical protein
MTFCQKIMLSSPDQQQQLETSAFRVVSKLLAAALALVAAYVWIVMCLAVLSTLEHGDMSDLLRLGVDYTWAFALDSICLGLLISGIFVRCNARLALAGLAIATLSFAMRLAEFLDPANHSMFWFEPFLRSGVYALAFALASPAQSLERATIRSSNTPPKSE